MNCDRCKLIEADLENTRQQYELTLKREREQHQVNLEANRRQILIAQSQAKAYQYVSDYYVEYFGVDQVPSMFEQTHYKGGLFEFPWSNTMHFFNMGCFEFAGEIWLVARRLKSLKGRDKNDIVFARYTGPKIEDLIEVELKPFGDEDNYEDPRVCVHRGNPWLQVCHFRNTGYAHQTLFKLNTAFQQLDRVGVPFGKNGKNIFENTGHEKNWTWFSHDNDRLNMVYTICPKHVVCESRNGVIEKAYETDLKMTSWHHGQQRGGSPPVLVDGQYWAFFHSATPWKGRQRRYHMGAYAFEAKPPYRVTRMSTIPILTGSEHDPMRHGLPVVCFPCGAIHKSGNWFVTFGVNDAASGWIEIPHQDIVESTKAL